ncbi:hypothetical protein [Amycolatopsis sp. NPDC051128]|uniref:hypothetical protein n=1 Tax=Amycolatopsis sp. NPDC051128 TaxID=3155412 RepID=UPI003426D1A9
MAAPAIPPLRLGLIGAARQLLRHHSSGGLPRYRRLPRGSTALFDGSSGQRISSSASFGA